MNDLRPDLKRLMRWARQAPEQAPAAAPRGFSARVIANWHGNPVQPDFALWQTVIWRSAWAAAAVIILGLALLTGQQLRPASFYDVAPACQVVSAELVP